LQTGGANQLKGPGDSKRCDVQKLLEGFVETNVKINFICEEKLEEFERVVDV
jgi:hypothetical protein